MTATQGTGPTAIGKTDFGREMNADSEAVSPAAAIRSQSARFARADAWRFHAAMAAAGFAAGSLVVLPLAVWLASLVVPAPAADLGPALRAIRALATGTATSGPALVSAPRLTEKIDRAEVGDGEGSAHRERASHSAAPSPTARGEAPGPLAEARQMIRDGNVAGARRLLASPELAERGDALFILAETFDPNVLAALGLRGVMAETEVARRLYARARDLGMTAADIRLDALR